MTSASLALAAGLLAYTAGDESWRVPDGTGLSSFGPVRCAYWRQAVSIPRAAQPHRCATSPLSRQSLRPVEVFIEPRQPLSTSGALIMER